MERRAEEWAFGEVSGPLDAWNSKEYCCFVHGVAVFLADGWTSQQRSAVAPLARLPGTAALSCLLDHGVFGSQPLPADFAAVKSAEHIKMV